MNEYTCEYTWEHEHPMKGCFCPGCEGARIGAKAGKRIGNLLVKTINEALDKEGLELVVRRKRRKNVSKKLQSTKSRSLQMASTQTRRKEVRKRNARVQRADGYAHAIRSRRRDY